MGLEGLFASGSGDAGGPEMCQKWLPGGSPRGPGHRASGEVQEVGAGVAIWVLLDVSRVFVGLCFNNFWNIGVSKGGKMEVETW